jgi:hypothetical protein
MSYRGLKNIFIIFARVARSFTSRGFGFFFGLTHFGSGSKSRYFLFVILRNNGVGEVGKKRKSWESSLAYLSCRPAPVVIVIVYQRTKKKKKYRNVGGPRRVKLN